MFSTISNDKQRNELEAFYKEYFNCFLNAAYSSLHNRGDAEDAVQDAFRDIASNPEKFFDIPPENRLRYMVAVVRNISVDMYNKKHRMPVESLDEETYADNLFSFEDMVIGNVSRDEFKRVISSLPPLQRDVLTFRCLMGYSTVETAEKLNISQSAVKKRLHLAKESIRKHIRAENETHE